VDVSPSGRLLSATADQEREIIAPQSHYLPTSPVVIDLETGAYAREPKIDARLYFTSDSECLSVNFNSIFRYDFVANRALDPALLVQPLFEASEATTGLILPYLATWVSEGERLATIRREFRPGVVESEVWRRIEVPAAVGEPLRTLEISQEFVPWRAKLSSRGHGAYLPLGASVISVSHNLGLSWPVTIPIGPKKIDRLHWFLLDLNDGNAYLIEATDRYDAAGNHQGAAYQHCFVSDLLIGQTTFGRPGIRFLSIDEIVSRGPFVP
jgi:hypothetical protein